MILVIMFYAAWIADLWINSFHPLALGERALLAFIIQGVILGSFFLGRHVAETQLANKGKP